MVTIKKKQTVYQGSILHITEHDLDFGNGKEATYQVVDFEVLTGVSALPIEGNDVLLLKHYMAGIETDGYSLPTGGLAVGEDPVGRMRMELTEELGMTASKIELMYRSDILPSYIGSEAGYVFLAQELSPLKTDGDEPYPIEVLRMSLGEALDKVRQNEIRDTRTIAALLYYNTFYR